ncbi:protein FAR1-RELATED SEQUENCE 11-like [Silene latifolia]|uniref:protein FAR1-RELATED SEQUENCE 11-like n=1 Tax=Silene latifolia TaxID=37657 RepID=UPI003D782E87
MVRNSINSSATKSLHERSNIINFFDLNNEPEDELCELINNGEGNIDRNSFEPFVGQCFLSEEEAYLFYENFARKSGFSIRREWHVTQFNSHHNHQLLSPIQVRFLHSYRSISKEDEQQLLLYKNAGLSVRLENIFWSPSHCFDLYQKYGDSTGFDTTYRVNLYDMIFGIFIGIDNHGRTILFGCALMRRETQATFCWLMKTFITLMKKPPMTIITDQDPWMSEAISIEMSSTKHAYCIWHITSKFYSWFTAFLRNRYSDWCSEFYRLYKLDNVDDFEQEWPLLVSKFDLQENKHVRGLYKIRRNWVPAYLRDYFFGGMTTTGRCESFNSFVKRFTSSRSCLTQLISQIDLAVEDIGQTQLHHTMLDTYRGSSLCTSSPLEEQVYKIFTAFSFKKFQEEFGRATQYTENNLLIMLVVLVVVFTNS